MKADGVSSLSHRIRGGKRHCATPPPAAAAAAAVVIINIM